MSQLSDLQQAFLMFGAFVLPSVGAWFGTGAPVDHTSLAMLGSGFLGGVIAFLKEYGGAAAPAPAPVKPVLYIKNADGSFSPSS